ncbi:hypothetical protein Hanom_Chr04g00363641 [Helianthus anomalus]
MSNLYLKSNQVVTTTLDHPQHLSAPKTPITTNEHHNNKTFTDITPYPITLMIGMSTPIVEVIEIVAILRTKTRFSISMI